MSQCNCCSVTRDSLSYVLSRPTPGKFNDCPSKRFSQTLSFCLPVAGGCWLFLLLQAGPPKDKSRCTKPELSRETTQSHAELCKYNTKENTARTSDNFLQYFSSW